MEEEIDLIDYIKIMMKRKFLILAFFLFGIIFALAFTFLQEKTYNAKTYLKIGSKEDSSCIENEIKAGLFGKYPKLKATNILGTDLIKISIVSNRRKKAIEQLNNINKLILESEDKKIKDRRKSLENLVKRLSDKVDFLLRKNNKITSLELKISNIQNEIDNMRGAEVIRKPSVVSEEKKSVVFNSVLGGSLGIFIGLFIVFCQEWWEKNKKKFSNL